MWNTFFSEPIRRREVRPEKIPVPVRKEPETPPEPQKQPAIPERQPEHVPA